MSKRSLARTYRSFNPAFFAISSDVDGGNALIVSNKPARWPMAAIKQRAPWLRAVKNFSEKASAFARSYLESVLAADMISPLMSNLGFVQDCGTVDGECRATSWDLVSASHRAMG